MQEHSTAEPSTAWGGAGEAEGGKGSCSEAGRGCLGGRGAGRGEAGGGGGGLQVSVASALIDTQGF